MQFFVGKKKVFEVCIAILLLLILITLGMLLFTPKVNKNNLVLPTPTVYASNKYPVLSKIPTETGNFPFQYPSNFTFIPHINPNDKTTTFTFTVRNQSYRFIVSPPGQINPEGSEVTNVDVKDVVYGGENFSRREWINNGVPFFIAAIPKDDTIPVVFSMELPPTDTNTYIQIFENIVASYKK